ncbi:hypothetical protein [Chryseobacterium sp. G0240]|nr:hypothetical protein [Chryseobacterium sp. G0240]
MAHGWITKDPFLGYKTKIKAVERPYLTKEEIQISMKRNSYQIG